MTKHDVIIVGAGLAGAAAAVKLADAGIGATILEARDRIGGRAYSRGFENGADRLEYGGSWITPWHQHIRVHAAKHAIALRPTHAITGHRFHDGSDLRDGAPSSAESRPTFDRAMQAIRADSLAYEQGDRSKAALSLARYLDLIDASPEARVHVLAWWTISGNGDPAKISASEFLSSCAYGGGVPEGMMTALRHTLDPGASVLAERMIAASGASVRLSAPVASIGQSAEGVTAMLAGGEQVAARHCDVCMPLNALKSVEFAPGLSARKAEAIARGHGGRALKLWIKAEGVAVGTLATGGGSGLQWMFAERSASDGATLIIAFGLDDGSINPASRADVEAAMLRFFPEAKLMSWDWHDWVNDPWARGTWVATPADALWIADHQEWAPEGRIAFATSDFSHDSPGWFEAAIAAGEASAEWIIDRMKA